MNERIMPVDGTISAGFNQMRPLGAQKKTHIHGALDIAAPVGTRIVLPEDVGEVIAFARVRNKKFPDALTSIYEHDGRWFPWSNYYYDTYGGCVVARANGWTHVFTHITIDDLVAYFPEMEVEEDEKFVLTISNLAIPYEDFEQGDVIGRIGMAGFTTGPHVHWEMHPGDSWVTYEDRIDPEAWLEDVS